MNAFVLEVDCLSVVTLSWNALALWNRDFGLAVVLARSVGTLFDEKAFEPVLLDAIDLLSFAIACAHAADEGLRIRRDSAVRVRKEEEFSDGLKIGVAEKDF